MKHLLPLLLCVSLAFISCGKKQPETKETRRPLTNKLVIYSTDAFRSSGLESTIVPEFSKKHGCKVEVILHRNASELSKAIKNPSNFGKYDIAIGIDNSFALSESLATYFSPIDNLDREPLSKELIFDPELRLIPYAYSSLCIVYNKSNISVPPQSFGELQDAKYMNQMAICDPHESGVGRASLFWSLALFGPDGYEHLWKSLRKNIYKCYTDKNLALEALKRGECNLLLSLNTIPAYLEELDPANQFFDISMLKEGSYQYIESLGMHRESVNHAMASDFINYILNKDTQKMVIYKLGMFPANRKTTLPMHFSTIPFTSYAVNNKLSLALIAEQLQIWLDFWDRLFGFQIA